MEVSTRPGKEKNINLILFKVSIQYGCFIRAKTCMNHINVSCFIVDGIFDEENRRPTNVCWIIPFIIAIITFIVFGVLATLTAGPGGIAVRLDPDNNFGSNCGFDSDVLDKTVRISIDDRKCGADPRLNYTCNHHHVSLEIK